MSSPLDIKAYITFNNYNSVIWFKKNERIRIKILEIVIWEF